MQNASAAFVYPASAPCGNRGGVGGGYHPAGPRHLSG